MQTTKGKLLVSTKSQTSGSKTVKLVCNIIYIALGLLLLLFALTTPRFFREMGRDLFSNATLGIVAAYVLSFFMVGQGAYYFIVNKVSFESYCDVYENMVLGKTSLSMRHPNDPVRDFEITYNEIISVTEAGKMLYIQTRYESYDVLALKNRSDALREIRTRMTVNQ